jgi:hypothetical protein
MKKCVNNPKFVDIQVQATVTTLATVPSTTESAQADCSPTKGLRCSDILGPNGGENACKWSNQMKKCVNSQQFVDSLFSAARAEGCP